MSLRSTNNLVGAAGEYYVCAKLCELNCLALLTPKNNPLFDVVATTIDGSRSVSIQVKTRSIRNTQGWKFGTDISKLDAPLDLFVVLVNLNSEKMPDFLVYRYSELSERVTSIYDEYISKKKQDGSPRKEVGFRWFDENNITDEERSYRSNNWKLITDYLGVV